MAATNTVHGITNLPTTAAERINKATESLESVIESTGNRLAEVGETAAAATDRLLDETIQIGGHAAGAVVNVHHHVSDAQKRVRSAAAKRREKAMRSIINRMATLEEFSLNDLYGEWDNVMSQISKAVIKRILLESTGLCVVHTAITDTVQNTKDFGKFIGRQASAFVHDPLHRAAVLLQSGVRRKQAVNEASRRTKTPLRIRNFGVRPAASQYSPSLPMRQGCASHRPAVNCSTISASTIFASGISASALRASSGSTKRRFVLRMSWPSVVR